MVITSSKALLIIYTLFKLRLPARMQLPIALQVSAAGTKYYYRGRAFNSITTSAYSNQTNATTLSSIPNPPSGLTITSTTSSSVTLAWTDNSNNETGFKIQRKKGATGAYTLIKTTVANITTYTDNDTALLDGTQYCYKVAATNSAGDSAFSNEACGITVMKAPTGLASTAVSASQINLTWTDNSLAEDGYYIEQSPVDNLHFVQIAATGPNATAYSVTNLTAGTKYYYRYERSIRLRLPHIAIRQMLLLLPVFPTHHQDLRLPPFCQTRSLSPGLTTLTMKRVSRSSGKRLQEGIPILQQREPTQRLTTIPLLRMALCITTMFLLPTPLGTLLSRTK